MIKSIIENLNGATLVVVSKHQPDEKILQVYNLGQRIFGENKVQGLIEKQERLPRDIDWHFIGHLQTNKVKQVVKIVSTIHSVDSIKLLNLIDKHAVALKKELKVLLQIKISAEETKFGLDTIEAYKLLDDWIQNENSQYVKIIGLMGMASNTEDRNTVRNEFRYLRTIFHFVKQKYFLCNSDFNQLSMGMSFDYQLAIEEGSTMVRIGNLIFSHVK